MKDLLKLPQPAPTAAQAQSSGKRDLPGGRELQEIQAGPGADESQVDGRRDSEGWEERQQKEEEEAEGIKRHRHGRRTEIWHEERVKWQPLSCEEATVYDLRSLSPGERAEHQASGREPLSLSFKRRSGGETFFFVFASFAAYSLVGLEDQQPL